MSKNLAITVLTWNDWENTVKCLESIYQSSFENFDIILEEATPNDGSESIFVPNLPSNNMSRLMVKSSNNIFFDVNNSFFSINNSALPVLGIDTTEIALELTTDSIFTIEREITNNGEIGSVLTYDIVIDYESNGNGFLTFDGYDDNDELNIKLKNYFKFLVTKTKFKFNFLGKSLFK